MYHTRLVRVRAEVGGGKQIGDNAEHAPAERWVQIDIAFIEPHVLVVFFLLLCGLVVRGHDDGDEELGEDEVHQDDCDQVEDDVADRRHLVLERLPLEGHARGKRREGDENCLRIVVVQVGEGTKEREVDVCTDGGRRRMSRANRTQRCWFGSVLVCGVRPMGQAYTPSKR